MEYSIIPVHEADGPDNGWFDCDPSSAEAWDIWTVEDGEALEFVGHFDTQEEAEDYLEGILTA